MSEAWAAFERCFRAQGVAELVMPPDFMYLPLEHQEHPEIIVVGDSKVLGDAPNLLVWTGRIHIPVLMLKEDTP